VILHVVRPTLLGTMLGGALVAMPGIGPTYVAIVSLVVAVLGRVAAGYIPASPAPVPELSMIGRSPAMMTATVTDICDRLN